MGDFIPEDWTIASIGDFCIVGDGAHGSLERVNSGILYLTSKNFKNGMLDLSKVEYIDLETYSKYFRSNSKALTQPKVDDILFSIIGTIGHPYLVKPQDIFGISSSVAILRPDAERIYSKYLFYWILGRVFQSALYGIKGGVAQGYISLEMIRSLPLYCPPPDIQRKIADILSAYDDLIENNTRRIQDFEESVQSLYREWFVEFRFPGYEDVPLVESELGMIPQGWEVVKLGKVCEYITSGGTPSTTIDEYWNGDIPWLSSGETRNRFIITTENTISNAGVDSSSTRCVRAFITVMASAGQGKTRGQVSLLTFPSYINQSILAISANNALVSDIFILFNLAGRYDELRSISDGASSRGSLTKRILEDLNVLLANENLLIGFDKFAQTMIDQIVNLLWQNQKLREARDILLPRLVSGELDISDLDINHMMDEMQSL
jgi:type I restriction enzyme S subunit